MRHNVRQNTPIRNRPRKLKNLAPLQTFTGGKGKPLPTPHLPQHDSLHLHTFLTANDHWEKSQSIGLLRNVSFNAAITYIRTVLAN